MNYLTAVHTDPGIKKGINQDSVYVEVADTDCGEVVLAAVCDGMGGLVKGEVASAALIRDFARWFHRQFPAMLYGGLLPDDLLQSWTELIAQTDGRLAAYGWEKGITLGTTAAAVLLVNGTYYILNVGDSRVYRICDSVLQLTRDQTVVQREVEMGRLTPEEARVSPRRNLLLQCVGAGGRITPDFYVGEYGSDEVFMLCSDGFRHAISPEEFYERMNPQSMRTEQDMQANAVYFTELNMARNERDNISVILIRAC